MMLQSLLSHAHKPEVGSSSLPLDTILNYISKEIPKIRIFIQNLSLEYKHKVLV